MIAKIRQTERYKVIKSVTERHGNKYCKNHLICEKKIILIEFSKHCFCLLQYDEIRLELEKAFFIHNLIKQTFKEMSLTVDYYNH